MKRICIASVLCLTILFTSCSNGSGTSSSLVEETQNTSLSSENALMIRSNSGEEKAYPAELKDSGLGFDLMVNMEFFDWSAEENEVLVTAKENGEKNYLTIEETKDSTIEELLERKAGEIGADVEMVSEESFGNRVVVNAKSVSSDDGETVTEVLVTEQGGKFYSIEISTPLEKTDTSALLHAMKESIYFGQG